MTEELRAGVTDPCFGFFGTGVLLARPDAGVCVRGKAGVLGMLSVSIFRFFAAGFALAVPFLGAARFLVVVALGFSEGLGEGFGEGFGEELPAAAGAGEDCLLASLLSAAIFLGTGVPSAATLGRREVAADDPAFFALSGTAISTMGEGTSVISLFTSTCSD